MRLIQFDLRTFLGLLSSLPLSIVAVLSAFGPAQAAFPGTAVPATGYEITLNKVELCSDVSCANSFVLGNSTKAFDIAAAGVGQSVGSYTDTSGLPVGQTFSHVRATIDEQITITGTGADGAVTCFTGTPDVQNGDHDTAELKNQLGGPAVPENYIVPARAGDFAGTLASDFTSVNIQDRTASGDVVILFPLTSPFTVGTTPPIIDIAFGTQTALGVSDQGGGVCLLFPLPPTVTITVQ